MNLPLEYQRLREAAEKATPGPWTISAIVQDGSCPITIAPKGKRFIVAEIPNAVSIGEILSGKFPECQWRNAEFVAVANPKAILDLLADYEKALERIRELETPATPSAESRVADLRQKIEFLSNAVYDAYEYGVCVKGRFTTRGDKWRERHKQAAGIANEWRKALPAPPSGDSHDD